WSSFLSIICLSSPMFGFNDRQLHRIQDSLLGSVAERVVQICPVPVLVVKAKPHDEK
ncbi:MAG: universal stress protein, partial [Candidatus Thiodiazotropha sp. (ex Rostrolucina anterorostrata)]|nr:universal stress protein [Candidatus Thiodiazotropha sp. (ex Rostrolucina anterorostrata)]